MHAEAQRPRRRPKKPAGAGSGSNLAGRVAVAIPAAIVALLAILTSPETLAIFVLVVGAIALHEFYVLSHHIQPIRLAGFATLAALVGAGLWGDQFQLVAIVAASFVVVFLMSAFTGPRRSPSRRRTESARSGAVLPRGCAPGRCARRSPSAHLRSQSPGRCHSS